MRYVVHRSTLRRNCNEGCDLFESTYEVCVTFWGALTANCDVGVAPLRLATKGFEGEDDGDRYLKLFLKGLKQNDSILEGFFCFFKILHFFFF